MSLSWLSGTRLRAGSALGVALVGGAMLLGACGSSNNSSNTTTTVAAGGSTGTASSTPAATGSSGTTSSVPASSGSSGTGTTVPASTGSTGSGGGNALQQITNKLKTGETQPFDAKYTVSGTGQVSSIEVASQPPSSFAFLVTSSSGAKEDLFGDASGGDACQGSPASANTWTCVSLPASGLGSYSAIVDIYTGKYWLNALNAIQAEAAGKGVTVSTKTVGGQSAQCATFGAASGGTVCVTNDGVLAYAKSNSSGDSFELTSLSSSPSASLFKLPPGASVQSIP